MNKLTSSQPLIFSIGMILFIVTAILGWIKLQYGFNFTDEGYYMTESWRLAAGDHFLKDKITGVLTLYTLVNSIIFKIYPCITLLEIRKLQFFLTIFSIILFSVSLFKITGEYWYLPLIFSLYAFTGLNPLCSLPNLSYQTYPHLFITLHLSFFILGIIQGNTLIRYVLLIISGIFLWAISFTVPHLSLIISSPLFVYLFIRYSGSSLYKYTVKDFIFITTPIVLGWVLFIGYYNTLYVQNLITSIKLLLSTPAHSSKSLINLNWQKLVTIGITLLYLIFLLVLIKKARSNKVVVTGIFAASLIMYYIINTSFWNQPEVIFWFYSRPMWLAALLISFFILFILKIVFTLFRKLKFHDIEVSGVIILIPVLLLIVSSSICGALGILSILQNSIPALASFSIVFLAYTRSKAKSLGYNALVLVMILAPFYGSIIYNNWIYNYDDVLTKDINAEIDKGFGMGIKTNNIYKGLYDWIATTTETYTKPNDFIISYVNSPMVHMIAKRRPSLDDTYIQYTEKPYGYYENALMKMHELKREPRLVFIFYSPPEMVPNNPQYIEETGIKPRVNYFRAGRQIESLIPARDPITNYVINHMYFLEKYNLFDDMYALCYVDNLESVITVLNRQLNQQPNNPDIYYKIGLLWKQKKEVDRALRYFIKSNEIAPNNKSVYQIVSIYSSQGGYEDALLYLRKLYKLQPENPEISYNIACIKAKQGLVDDATSWLKTAVEKGFHNWDLIKNDPDLANIRNTAFINELLKNH